MKVLLSAYSCEPGRGSEPGIGWNVAREIARHHDVWVLTRPDESGDAIERELQQHPNPRLKFVYWTTPLVGSLWRMNQSGAMQLHYYLWQLGAYRIARRLHRDIGFDVVHHVTFARYSAPSFLATLPVPFILGPVGGAEGLPAEFRKGHDWRAMLYEAARSLWRKFGEIDPLTRATIRRASVALAATPETGARLKALGARDVRLVPAIALSRDEIERLNRIGAPPERPFRVLCIGRLLHWKAYHLGIRAFARAQLPDSELWLIGEGPERAALERLVAELGCSAKVRFLGAMPRDQVLATIADCHVLLHPSLHESGGYVSIEALAAGRPVVCLQLGGSAVIVSPECGICVRAENPEQVVADLGKALQRLHGDPAERERLGAAGRVRVSGSFDWYRRGLWLAGLYKEVTGAT